MAGKDITKGGGGQLQRPTDVFSAMRDEMDRLFERFEQGWPSLPSLFRQPFDEGAMIPALDVHESDKELTINIDLPGVAEKDVTVTLADGLLTVKGEKRSETEEKKGNYHVAERSYGSFQRSIRLPESVDDARLAAHMDNGVLKITAQKKPEAVRAERRIEIGKKG
jgi:HSP20 family protein